MKNKLFNTVYIYTTDVKKPLGRFKVGKADRVASSKEKAAMIRIQEQFTAGNRDEKVDLIHVYDCDEINIRSIDLEGKIHALLKKYRVGGEWFETGTPDPIFTAYNKIVNGVEALNNYKMREEQCSAVEKCYNYFKNEGNVFLFNAIMRYGKCFTSYQVMKRLEAKKVLILTYKPAIKDSWSNDLDHIDFEGYKYYDAQNFSTNSPIKIPDEEKGVLFSSFQDVLGKDINSGRIKQKWLKAIKENFDLVIIDEVHYGFSSKKAQEFISKLKYTYRIDLSGTPINLLNSGYYESEQIFNWTYIDEQKRKKQNPDNEAYIWLPSLNMYTFRVSEEVLQYAELYNEKEYFSLNKLFGAKTENTFKNNAAVQRFLDDLACPEKRMKMTPFNDDKVAPLLKHMFWYLPSVNSTKAMKRKLETHPFFSKYRIIVAAGDNDGERSDTLELVQNSIDKVELQILDCKGKVGTITLSCGKLNTGVSVKKWNAVFFLNELESVQTYWQTAFRGKTPDKESGKLESYVFDFNPNRALNMAYSFAEELSGSESSNMGTIRELLDNMNWLAYEGNRLVKQDPEELLRAIVDEGTDMERTARRFSSDWLFSKSPKIDKRIENILSSMSETKNQQKDDVEVSTAPLAKGKTHKSNTESEAVMDMDGMTEREVKNKIATLVNKARTITNALPTYLWTSEEKEENVNDILNTNNLLMFKDICGVEVDEFKVLVETGFINKHKLNKAIESFNLLEE